MFRSQVTKQLSEPGEKQQRSVVVSRSTKYINKLRDGRVIISYGYETIREVFYREGEQFPVAFVLPHAPKEIYHGE